MVTYMTESIKLSSFQKAVVTAILIFAIVVASGWAAMQGADVTLNLQLQARVDALEDALQTEVNPTVYTTESPYQAVIAQAGSRYVLKNGTNSYVMDSSTNLTLVETWATGNFTSGVIYCKNVAWNDDVTVSGNLMVIEDLNGVRRYISNNAIQYNRAVYQTKYTIDYNETVVGNYSAVRYDGYVAWSSTNAATIFNNAITTVRTPSGTGVYGGTVYVKKASIDYAIGTAIQLKDKVDLIAEKDTTLIATTNLAPSLLYIEASTTTAYDLKVSGFRIEGQSLCNYGITLLNATTKIILEDMQIGGFNSSALELRGTWGVTGRNLRLSANTGGYALNLERYPEANTGNNLNTFYNVHATESSGASTGIRIKGDAYGNSFYDSFITNSIGVRITGVSPYTPTLTRFINTWWERGEAPTTQRAVWIDDVSEGSYMPRLTVIENGHFGYYDIGIFVQYGNHTVIRSPYFDTSMVTDDINIASTADNTLIDSGWYDDAGIDDNGLNTTYIGISLGW